MKEIQNQTKILCVEMSGPDVGMDRIGDGYEPVNKLPTKCNHCSFPDLNAVAKPYLLNKGISAPREISSAEVGNFLVSERVRRILEVAVPGACSFYPTADQKSKKPAQWWLAVPNQILETPIDAAEPPFCPKCKEPKVWSVLPKPLRKKMMEYDTRGVDVFKSLAWQSDSCTAEEAFAFVNIERQKSGHPLMIWKREHPHLEPPSHPERWTRERLERDLYFSVRLEQLLKEAKVKGNLVRSAWFKSVETSHQDEVWIREKLALLADRGLVGTRKSSGSKAARAGSQWLGKFIKKNPGKGGKSFNFGSLEKKQKLKLPDDYKRFMSAVGTKSFKDVNGMEGSTTTVMLPTELDFKTYRSGKVPYLEGEEAKVDGVMFAAVDSFDVFVFDIRSRDGIYPVYFYNHEENALEPFAPNFAKCIKRFVERN